MNWRALSFPNAGLKLFSLALAALIWCTIWFSQNYGINRREFSGVPVNVMREAADHRTFRLTPAAVTVTISGPPWILEALSSKDIQALVNLANLQVSAGLFQKVEVLPPSRTSLVSVEPQTVFVEQSPAVSRLSPPP